MGATLGKLFCRRSAAWLLGRAAFGAAQLPAPSGSGSGSGWRGLAHSAISLTPLPTVARCLCPRRSRGPGTAVREGTAAGPTDFGGAAADREATDGDGDGDGYGAMGEPWGTGGL
jgi:hypothetical protein